ncbi:MAG: alpha-amylase [Bacteroidales bacterium]|nr:alpha-amylase [Bacteroidales bacterium]
MGKMIVYQMLPRLWGNGCQSPVRGGSLLENGTGKFRNIDSETLSFLRDGLGVSHVWYTGVIRHATTVPFEGCLASNPMVVKGKAGSPYAITDYYDVNPYLADNPEDRMSEFESLLNRTHDAGMKVLIDFVSNHVSRDYGKAGMTQAPGRPPVLGSTDDCSVHWCPGNDFFYYPGQPLILPVPWNSVTAASPFYENPAKASGNCFSPSPGFNDWYETIRLNYCDFPTPTWDRMLDIVRFWCSKGVDGFRCDMVEMVPWQFMKWLIARIKEDYPEVIFIAEVYRKELYRHYVENVGFDFLYDKSGLYDTLRGIASGNGDARGITWNWQALGNLQPKMLNFLENHDEQRFASPYFGSSACRTGAFLCASMLFNTSPFMIYSGEEVGEAGMEAEGFSGTDGRTTIFDWWSVGSLRRLYDYVHTGEGLEIKEAACLRAFKKAAGLAQGAASGKTFDLCYCNQDSPGFDPGKHFAFLRGGNGSAALFVANFSSEDAFMYLRIPAEAMEFMGVKKTETSFKDVSVNAWDYSALPV